MPAPVNNSIRSPHFCASLGLLASLLMGLPALTGAAPAHRQSSYSLIIFAPGAESSNLSKQKAVVAAEKERLQQRGVAVVYVVGQTASAELGPEPTAIPVKLRQHYRVGKDDFRVVLIAKGGATQMLSDVPVTADQLYQTIDAVPAPKDEP